MASVHNRHRSCPARNIKMINLLPPEEKNILFRKRTEKLVAVLSFVVLIPMLCLIILLIAVKFYVLSEVAHQTEIIQEKKNRHLGSDSAALSEAISDYNNLLSRTENFYKDRLYVSQALKTILDANRPEGVYFKRISAKREGSGKMSVEISGDSRDRDSLLLFKKNIEGQSAISDVSLSPSSLVKQRDVNFTINFKVSYVP